MQNTAPDELVPGDGALELPGRRAGRRPGASSTREAILESARRLFGERGLEAVSVRAIARDAGVDPGLVSHFYGSKYGLFLAAVELPFDAADVLPGLLAGPASTLGERLATFIVEMLEHPLAQSILIARVRAATSEPRAAEMLSELVCREMFTPVIEHLDADHPETRAAYLGAQIVGLAMARYVVKLPPLEQQSPEEVVTTLAPILQHLLTGQLDRPIPARPAREQHGPG